MSYFDKIPKNDFLVSRLSCHLNSTHKPIKVHQLYSATVTFCCTTICCRFYKASYVVRNIACDVFDTKMNRNLVCAVTGASCLLGVPNKELKISKATCVTKFPKVDDPGILHVSLKP